MSRSLETLHRMRELLTPERWVNHCPKERWQECLATAEFNADPTWPVTELLELAIQELYPERVGGGWVVGFNDHPLTTYQDILRVLGRTEELCRAGADA